MKAFVVDASTSLKWIFSDEENALIARKILYNYLEKKITLVAPSLWLYEVSNGINSAQLSGRISFKKAQNLLSLIMRAKPHLFSIESTISKCLFNSNKYKISVYDSSYITLAQENEVGLISSDRKLTSKFENISNLVIPLENFHCSK